MTILVTYASRSGSTAEIAQAIAETLTHQALSVDIRAMTDVTDLAMYQGIVMGSAIRQERWLPEVTDFIETYQPILRQKPVATFLVCMALAKGQDQRTLRTVSHWMTPIRDLINPVDEGYFAGVLELNKIKELRFRIALGLMVRIGLFSEGDHRDWVAIRNWATALPAKLLTQTTNAQTAVN